jgi:hypothetical protein
MAFNRVNAGVTNYKVPGLEHNEEISGPLCDSGPRNLGRHASFGAPSVLGGPDGRVCGDRRRFHGQLGEAKSHGSSASSLGGVASRAHRARHEAADSQARINIEKRRISGIPQYICAATRVTSVAALKHDAWMMVWVTRQESRFRGASTLAGHASPAALRCEPPLPHLTFTQQAEARNFVLTRRYGVT